MSFFDDAQKFMQSRTKPQESEETVDLTDTDVIERLTKELKMLYENATEREISRAIDLAHDRFGNTPVRKEFLLFVRTKLED